MTTIYKYPIEIADSQIVSMPRGAKILTVQVQREQAYLWAMVDLGEHVVNRTILIYGTGHAIHITEYLAYVGTIQMAGGNLVWHVFDLQKEEPSE